MSGTSVCTPPPSERPSGATSPGPGRSAPSWPRTSRGAARPWSSSRTTNTEARASCSAGQWTRRSGRRRSMSPPGRATSSRRRSVVEVGTTICENVDEARDQLGEMRRTLSELLQPEGLRIACAGTHPFSRWQEQQITDNERYKMLEEELQDVVRSLVIFGLQVHVAIPNPELRIEVLNEARYFLPHLLALSTPSPSWMGRNTGSKSYRSVIWSNSPRTGNPPA